MIRDLCEKLEFPQEATDLFCETYEKVISSREALSQLKLACDEVFLGEKNESYLPYAQKAAEILNVEFYTLNMVFWLMCTEPMRYIYKMRNISEDMFYEVLKDLKYKLDTCKTRYGIWGSSSNWYRNFYRGTRFAFGRLQYDKDVWQFEDYKNFVKKGDLIFRAHIPACGPLYPEKVIESFKLLYDYFRDELKDGILVIQCSSWLLYPPMIEVCNENSNMRKFYDMFDILEEKPYENPYFQFMTIFNQPYIDENSLINAPEDTSFRRIMKKYFREGKGTGNGRGVILFDGEKIITL